MDQGVNLGRKAISDEIKEEALECLNNHVEKEYIGRYSVKKLNAKFKGRYLYIDWIEGILEEKTDEKVNSLKMIFPNADISKELLEQCVKMTCRDSKPQKLCRIRYTGDFNYWTFEIYKYSDNWYDTEEEFPFIGGTIEKCFDAAASLYITETFP